MIKDVLVKVESGLVALDELPNIIPFFQIARWKATGQKRSANRSVASSKAKSAPKSKDIIKGGSKVKSKDAGKAGGQGVQRR